MRKFKYISNITEDELDDNCVISCINENGMPCILIKNAIQKTVSNYYSTDNLDVKFNSVLELHDVDYYFHVITSKRDDDISKQQFEIVFDYVFNKLDNPVDEDGLNRLFGSIEEFFRITPEPENRLVQIGLFGELLTVKNIYNHGYENIVNKYHKDFFMKHDVEINNETRIEIKATTSTVRIHNFKHDQIRRKDVDVYVASLLLEESQEGLSLYELFNQVISINSDPENIFSLIKLMKKYGISEEKQGVCFSEELALMNMQFYNAKDLPQINIDAIEGVSNISYSVDCSFTPSIPIDDLIKLFNSL